MFSHTPGINTRSSLLSGIASMEILLLGAALISAPAAAAAETDTETTQEKQVETADPAAIDLLVRGPSVLIFTSLNCPISERYVPTVQKLSERFSDSFSFVTTYVEAFEARDDVAAHSAQFPATERVLLDSKGQLADSLAVDVSSTAVVIDATGALVYRGRINDLNVKLGQRRAAPSQHDLRAVLESLEAGGKVPFRETPVVGCFLELTSRKPSQL